LFATQWLGAFNGSLFTSSLCVGITRHSATGLSPNTLIALSSAVFILSFLLFSALAGQLADKYPKATLVRAVKLGEIVVISVAGLAFVTGNIILSLGALLLMGMQWTFLGPLTYGALPELLPISKRVRANAWVELGIFAALLLGTIFGATLVSHGTSGRELIAAAGVMIAVLGLVSSRAVPKHASAARSLRLDYRPFRASATLLRIASEDRTVWHSVLGICWLWLIIGLIVSLLPGLVAQHFGGIEIVVTYVLTLLSIGVGVGSHLCAKLSRQRPELGVVPIGALGITIFLCDAALALSGTNDAANHDTLQSLLVSPLGLRLSADLGLFAVCCGIVGLPLRMLQQERSSEQTRARLIASKGMMNAAFMVLGSMLLIGLLALGASVPQILAFVAIAHVVIAIYTYSAVPEFIFRFMCFCLAHVLYRLKVSGLEHIPARGAAVLACNHVTSVDWLILSAVSPRPIRFVTHHEYLKLHLSSRFFRDAKLIPIASAKEDPSLLDAAFHSISEALKNGELVGIFPEGKLTPDGETKSLRRGIERILASDPVPVVPMRLEGLWKSFFSSYRPRRPFGRVGARAELSIGGVLDPSVVTAAYLERKIATLSTTAANELCMELITRPVARAAAATLTAGDNEERAHPAPYLLAARRRKRRNFD
jgi:1-acyl-sn-glycerol-3-phosphate acyltransferase